MTPTQLISKLSSLRAGSLQDLADEIAVAASEQTNYACQIFGLLNKAKDLLEILKEHQDFRAELESDLDLGHLPIGYSRFEKSKSTTYDFSNSPEWVRLNERVKAEKDRLKLLEEQAKTLAKHGANRVLELQDTDTGEVSQINPAIVRVTDTFKLTK